MFQYNPTTLGDSRVLPRCVESSPALRLPDFQDEEETPAFSINISKYQSLIDSDDLPDDQKKEFVLSLWSILTNLIELGIDLNEIAEFD